MLFRYLSAILALASATAYATSPYAPTTGGTQANPKLIGDYDYDSTSNRLTNNHGQIINMGLLCKPIEIKQDSKSETYHHGLGGIHSKTYLRVHADGRKTFYLHDMEYRLPSPNDTSAPTSVVYIRATGYSPNIQADISDSANPQYAYFLKDHLGSPLVTVADDDLQHQRFDPWGAVTAATGVTQDLSTNTDTTQHAERYRGFTGQEQIGFANLMNFNARFYDHQTGFLGPDIFIQGKSLPSLNRFAYVQHNALNNIDPSGWRPILHIQGLEGISNLSLRRDVQSIFRKANRILPPATTHVTFRNIQRERAFGVRQISFQMDLTLERNGIRREYNAGDAMVYTFNANTNFNDNFSSISNNINEHFENLFNLESNRENSVSSLSGGNANHDEIQSLIGSLATPDTRDSASIASSGITEHYEDLTGRIFYENHLRQPQEWHEHWYQHYFERLQRLYPNAAEGIPNLAEPHDGNIDLETQTAAEMQRRADEDFRELGRGLY